MKINITHLFLLLQIFAVVHSQTTFELEATLETEKYCYRPEGTMYNTNCYSSIKNKIGTYGNVDKHDDRYGFYSTFSFKGLTDEGNQAMSEATTVNKVWIEFPVGGNDQELTKLEYRIEKDITGEDFVKNNIFERNTAAIWSAWDFSVPSANTLQTLLLCGPGGPACVASKWTSTSTSTTIIGRLRDSGGNIIDTQAELYGKPKLKIEISPRPVDKTPPVNTFSGFPLVSYIKGKRTLYFTLEDSFSEIAVDTVKFQTRSQEASSSGDWVEQSVLKIGCTTNNKQCRFSAEFPNTKDYGIYGYELLWADTSGEAGTNDKVTGDIEIKDPENANPDDKKLSVFSPELRANSGDGKTFDRQLQYYKTTGEYYFEFDTERCDNTCFSTSSSMMQSQWSVKWQTDVKLAQSHWDESYSGTTGFQKLELLRRNGGYLTLDGKDGPGGNLLLWYKSDSWNLVRVGDVPSISPRSPGYEIYEAGDSYGDARGYAVNVEPITGGSFGELSFGTGTTTVASFMCVSDNGLIFFRQDQNSCQPSYNHLHGEYSMNAIGLGVSYYGSQPSRIGMSYTLETVKKKPDITAPEIDHSGIGDSVRQNRTITAKIQDMGQPEDYTGPVGLKTSGPDAPFVTVTLTFLNGDTTDTKQYMTPVSGSLDNCQYVACVWSTDINMGDATSATYSIIANDNGYTNVVGKDDILGKTRTIHGNFIRKVSLSKFVVEWENMAFNNNDNFKCTYQAHIYDIGEIEIKYDEDCLLYWDYTRSGIQNKITNNHVEFRKNDDSGSWSSRRRDMFNFGVFTEEGQHGEVEKGPLGLTTIDNIKASWQKVKSQTTFISGTYNGYPTSHRCKNSQENSACTHAFSAPFDFQFLGSTISKNSNLNVDRQGSLWGNTASNTAKLASLSYMYRTPAPFGDYAPDFMIAPLVGYLTPYYMFTGANVNYAIVQPGSPGAGYIIDTDLVTPESFVSKLGPITIKTQVANTLLIAAVVEFDRVPLIGIDGAELNINQNAALSIVGSSNSKTIVNKKVTFLANGTQHLNLNHVQFNSDVHLSGLLNVDMVDVVINGKLIVDNGVDVSGTRVNVNGIDIDSLSEMSLNYGHISGNVETHGTLEFIDVSFGSINIQSNGKGVLMNWWGALQTASTFSGLISPNTNGEYLWSELQSDVLTLNLLNTTAGVMVVEADISATVTNKIGGGETVTISFDPLCHQCNKGWKKELSDNCPPGTETLFDAPLSRGTVEIQPSFRCEPCPKGTFSGKVGASHCFNCPKGTYSDKTGLVFSAQCALCPKGTYNTKIRRDDKSACLECIAGRYSSKEGLGTIGTASAQCVHCPQGLHSEQPGSTQESNCRICPNHFIFPANTLVKDMIRENCIPTPCLSGTEWTHASGTCELSCMTAKDAFALKCHQCPTEEHSGQTSELCTEGTKSLTGTVQTLDSRSITIETCEIDCDTAPSVWRTVCK